MTYSIDLRRRVVAFVTDGRSKSEASRRFSVSRKLDEQALIAHVKANPLMLAKDRAAHFGVDPTSITRAYSACA
jgi:hypothetical protein